ncbi:hypothetical protein [Herbaspirillum sp.]|jgi:hypothetical protein|uniref:hypothetical protein n=1 Tax=Herbaspirillum TaxID=963 RepID=UPI00258B1F62|nr:hypothetical protein [Herbaspirillum sp.]MCP3654581.1 hypothetical protein [Herbaspirillum sp.]MCP3948665.1 hypothetical protein [Herbaspirillum sp.]MCP4033244.1 hypothetical protein [Herbaspirillum sp.]MCP4556195.1 hypothetical protein [Herbaspirillum sp.]
MTEDQKRIQQASIEWMVRHKDAFNYAVTLTLKSYRRLKNDRGQAVEQLSHFAAKSTLAYFVKRLNIALFGKAAKRFGRSVSIIPVLEGHGADKRLHYHCAIGGLPEKMSVDTFNAAVRDAWSKTPFGYNEIRVTPISNVDWFSYMGKEIGLENADVLDWENVVIPSATTSLV